MSSKPEKTDAVEARGQLSNDDIARYSRQIILPGFGVEAQLKLKSSSVLIVGAGGLGCPAGQYLLAAGCGTLGLVDYDEVERSNFHRQTLHTEARIGWPKVKSAAAALAAINPNCQIKQHHVLLDSSSAMDVLSAYDLILDCTDNVATRYLLNDACVLLHKPLVSGSALQLDGQLTVYNYGETGPCYRCLFPVPPPPGAVTNCSDGGVIGPVPGVIGTMQALEAIKIIVGVGEVLSGRLLLFDGLRSEYRNIKLRARRKDCAVCSAQPIITRLIDYEQFCGMHASDTDAGLELLKKEQRLWVEEYQGMQASDHLLLDVRQPAEFEICHLPGAKNMPLKHILDNSWEEQLAAQLADARIPIVFICRRGNDSQLAVQHASAKHPDRSIRDIEGGLHAWHHCIDKGFPIY